jgi:hypothetical protein
MPARPHTNDVVFGISDQNGTWPEPAPTKVVFNELFVDNNTFWLELINVGVAPADGRWSIVRRGGATNRVYTLPAHLLVPSQLLTITKAEIGWPGFR